VRNKERVGFLQLHPNRFEPRAVRSGLGDQRGGAVLPDGLLGHRSVASVNRLRAAARTLRKGAQLRVELTGPDGSVRKDGASANSAPQRLLRALAAGIKNRKSDRVQAERI